MCIMRPKVFDPPLHLDQPLIGYKVFEKDKLGNLHSIFRFFEDSTLYKVGETYEDTDTQYLGTYLTGYHIYTSYEDAVILYNCAITLLGNTTAICRVEYNDITAMGEGTNGVRAARTMGILEIVV